MTMAEKEMFEPEIKTSKGPDLTGITSKLFEILGILRMIGNTPIEGSQTELLHSLEAAVWGARAAETLTNELLETIGD